MKIYQFKYNEIKGKTIDRLDFTIKPYDIFKSPEILCSYKIKTFVLPKDLKIINKDTIDNLLHIEELEANGVEKINENAFFALLLKDLILVNLHLKQ